MTREEAIKLIDTHTVCFYNEIDSPTLQALHLAIEALQTDSVQVVRCKDCQYRKKIGTLYYCDLDEYNVKDTDFCSWGERKEE